MTKQEFDKAVDSFLKELSEMREVLETPERILTEFFLGFRPNALMNLTQLIGISEEELGEVVAVQISKLPVLEYCTVISATESPSGYVEIEYKNPCITLFVVDLIKRKYQNVYRSAQAGLTATKAEGTAQILATRNSAEEISTMMEEILAICEGDLNLRTLGNADKKRRLRQLLKENLYSNDEIKGILSSLPRFMENSKKEYEKRVKTLLEIQNEYASDTEKLKALEENGYLLHTISEIQSLLEEAKFQEKDLI